MRKTQQKDTPGQKLWIGLLRGNCYDAEAKKIALPSHSGKLSAEQATKHWLEGMSRHLKRNFSTGLRQVREELAVTQQQLADFADLTVTAVAMIERGERAPNLETAARLCWAIDVAAGVTLEYLKRPV